jgi:hypothetical protein
VSSADCSRPMTTVSAMVLRARSEICVERSGCLPSQDQRPGRIQKRFVPVVAAVTAEVDRIRSARQSLRGLGQIVVPMRRGWRRSTMSMGDHWCVLVFRSTVLPRVSTRVSLRGAVVRSSKDLCWRLLRHPLVGMTLSKIDQPVNRSRLILRETADPLYLSQLAQRPGADPKPPRMLSAPDPKDAQRDEYGQKDKIPNDEDALPRPDKVRPIRPSAHRSLPLLHRIFAYCNMACHAPLRDPARDDFASHLTLGPISSQRQPVAELRFFRSTNGMQSNASHMARCRNVHCTVGFEAT